MIERDVVRAVALDERRRVLMGLRSNGHSTDMWALFGGKVDRNEQPIQALRREFLEETGADLADITELFGGRPVEDIDDKGVLWKTRYYMCRVAGRIALNHSDQQSEARFFSQSELATIPVAFGHDKILEVVLDQDG